MSDQDTHSSVKEELLNEISKIDEPSDETSDQESDVESEKVESDAVPEETNEESETESEEGAEESKDDEAPDFDFRSTKTSVDNLMQNLSGLSEEARAAKIDTLTRKADIEAAKKSYPEHFEEKVSYSKKEMDLLKARLDKVENSEKTMELLGKLEASRPNVEIALRNSMLKDQFGDEFKEVITDPKFIAAYDKYPTLEPEDRLELACSLSPVARKLALGEAKKKASITRAVKSPGKGTISKPEKKEVSAREYLTAKGMEAVFGEALDKLG